jgi:glutamate decarboxylase
MSDKLRERGWLLPAYTFPRNRTDLAVLRCVCKEGFTRDMADMLIKDMRAAVYHFAAHPNHEPKTKGSAFHH